MVTMVMKPEMSLIHIFNLRYNMTYEQIMKTCTLTDYKHEIIGKLGFTQWVAVYKSNTHLYQAIFSETCTDKPKIIMTFTRHDC